MAGQTSTPSKHKAAVRATTPDGTDLTLPTPAASGRADTSRPKQLPTVTPRRFKRFFTPRSSLRRNVKISASRQALRDITAGDTNRKPLGRQRSSKVDTIQIFEDENALSETSSRKRKRGFPATPDATPELSSPLKRCRPQSGEESDTESEDELRSGSTSPRKRNGIGRHTLENARPIVRWRQSGFSAQKLQQECGGLGRTEARVELQCGAGESEVLCIS